MSEASANTNHCSQCGTVLPGATQGLCPRCLMAHVVQPTHVDGADSQSPIPPEELAPLFPQLEILQCLGRGGMGVVYKARQKSLNRPVALKLLAPERAGDAEFASRFAREAQALAALNHPNIVSVYDFGEAGGFYYLLMEFVDGVNLRQRLRAKRLTPKEALSIVPFVCDALQCAHDHGIVHRDIKPENMLIDRTGIVKIADFGIAKMMGDGTAGPDGVTGTWAGGTLGGAGTPAYAAPEQREGNGTADHRADIYSLGAVFYEMLTGERPKDRLEPPSRRVEVDVRIDEIVLRALEKSPEMRFATMAEFRTQVESVRSSVVSNTRWSPVRWAAIIIVALAVGGLAYTTYQDGRRKPVRGPLIFQPAAAAPEKMPATLDEAVLRLESTFAALLMEERAAALETTSDAPDDLQGRELRMLDLRQRTKNLERLIEKLAAPATPQPTVTTQRR